MFGSLHKRKQNNPKKRNDKCHSSVEEELDSSPKTNRGFWGVYTKVSNLFQKGDSVMNKRFFIRISVIVILIFSSILLGNIGEATTIDTFTNWSGEDYVIPFGEPNTATYGQVFEVPNSIDTILTAFSFFMRDEHEYIDEYIDFKPYIYEWDGNKITGSALFEGPVMSTTSAVGWEEMSVNTGGVSLDLGKQYVAFFSASGLFGDGKDGRAEFAAIHTNIYPDGSFVFFNNGNDFSQLFTSRWQEWSYDDLAFRFEFNNVHNVPVPEPATATMLGSGLLWLASGWKSKWKVKKQTKTT